jgi:hypothetical protein
VAFCKMEASLWVSEALQRGSDPGREPNYNAGEDFRR